MPVRRSPAQKQILKDQISETETAIINCHFLAGDLLDLVARNAFVDELSARTLAMALTTWAHTMALVIEELQRNDAP